MTVAQQIVEAIELGRLRRLVADEYGVSRDGLDVCLVRDPATCTTLVTVAQYCGDGPGAGSARFADERLYLHDVGPWRFIEWMTLQAAAQAFARSGFRTRAERASSEPASSSADDPPLPKRAFALDGLS